MLLLHCIYLCTHVYIFFSTWDWTLVVSLGSKCLYPLASRALCSINFFLAMLKVETILEKSCVTECHPSWIYSWSTELIEDKETVLLKWTWKVEPLGVSSTKCMRWGFFFVCACGGNKYCSKLLHKSSKGKLKHVILESASAWLKFQEQLQLA